MDRILTTCWNVLTAWWRVFLDPDSATFGDGMQITIAVLVALALLVFGVTTKELRGDTRQ